MNKSQAMIVGTAAGIMFMAAMVFLSTAEALGTRPIVVRQGQLRVVVLRTIGTIPILGMVVVVITVNGAGTYRLAMVTIIIIRRFRLSFMVIVLSA